MELGFWYQLWISEGVSMPQMQPFILVIFMDDEPHTTQSFGMHLVLALQNVLPSNVEVRTAFWNEHKRIATEVAHATAIVISGSKYRILDRHSPTLPSCVMRCGVPVLGICYGFQWMARFLQGRSAIGSLSPDGKEFTYTKLLAFHAPFKLPRRRYRFLHHDFVKSMPPDWTPILWSPNREQVWAAFNSHTRCMGIQFHPEALGPSGREFYRAWWDYVNPTRK